ncbi:MAG: hypothetical protein ACTSQE_17415 [Candidatus Heimdallarchaeaceae archaeon]
MLTNVTHEGKPTIYTVSIPDVRPKSQVPLILYYVDDVGNGGECTTKYYVVSCLN